MSCFVIADNHVHDTQAYKEYLRLITPTVFQFQGEYLVRGGDSQLVSGTWQPQRLVVIKFPSRDLADQWLNDPDVKPIHEMRLSLADCHMVVVDGAD